MGKGTQSHCQIRKGDGRQQQEQQIYSCLGKQGSKKKTRLGNKGLAFHLLLQLHQAATESVQPWLKTLYDKEMFSPFNYNTQLEYNAFLCIFVCLLIQSPQERGHVMIFSPRSQPQGHPLPKCIMYTFCAQLFTLKLETFRKKTQE